MKIDLGRLNPFGSCSFGAEPPRIAGSRVENRENNPAANKALSSTGTANHAGPGQTANVPVAISLAHNAQANRYATSIDVPSWGDRDRKIEFAKREKLLDYYITKVQAVEVPTHDNEDYRKKSHFLFGGRGHFGTVHFGASDLRQLTRTYGQVPDGLDNKLAKFFGILIKKIHIHVKGSVSMMYFNFNTFAILNEIGVLSSKRKCDVIQNLIAEVDPKELAQDSNECERLVRKIIESLKSIDGEDAGVVLGTLSRWINGRSGVQAYNHELAKQLSLTVEDARATLCPIEFESF
ncbi:hypothetical protein [Paraburkholderia sediminicola]|uniref:hypothetical protein n=1 Tax=Paraburkholderia sediminicola TaxID=458836 RepID=UPI0038BB9067